MIKNLKKVISTLAAVAILATSASAFAVSFPDVDANASYAGAVEALTTLGVVNGDDNGKFNPENTVTRAEFAKMVVEALGAGSEAASSTDTKFVDAKGHWAAGYIETGVAKAFINGYDEKTFGPDDQVTYAQAVKMLVAAIGYETYASQQGGWPSGYLAYGSSLDIIAGVTGVANDTALTRAQCAVLIYNTLKAPICKVDGYEQNYKGEWVPNLEEMNGTAKGWQTLLTSKHDAFVVRGRVMPTDNTNKQKGTVGFMVEAAENFDGIYVTGGKAYNVANNGVATEIKDWEDTPMYAGTTAAAEMLYTYSEAIVQKDEVTSEYTLVAITPYGAAKTVEFAAKDIAPSSAPNTIEVKKENSNKTTTYKLSASPAPVVFVNGEKSTNGLADKALTAANVRGTVTLVDSPASGSAATDGRYDYVMVDKYDVGQVTNVRVKNDTVKLYATGVDVIEWSLVDEDTTSVVFYKDGAEISYEDVKEDDIILVKNDSKKEWYEVYVSDKTVSGTATGKSTTAGKQYLLVDGTKYEFDNPSEIATMDLNVEYVLYLDAAGYVYHAEPGESSKNIGVVVNMYNKIGDTYPTVKMIDANGEEVTYELKDDGEAKEIYKIATNKDALPEGDEYLKKPASAAELMSRVIEYTVSNGKLLCKKAAEIANKSDATVEYKASTSRLDSYAIDATATKILDFTAYLANKGEVGVFDAANFEDEGEYDAWIYDRNKTTKVHGLVLITNGTTSLKPTSTLAVVTASGSVTDVDGMECEVLTVARGSEEDIEVLVEAKYENKKFVSAAAEGSVIMYTVGAEGYVALEDLHVITAPAKKADLFAKATSDFTKAIKDGKYIVASDKSKSGYTLQMNDKTDEEVEIYYGPVYTASATALEIFTSADNGASDINKTEAFTLTGANVYTFSYDAIEGEGMSVSVVGSVQKSSIYKNMYADTDVESKISWTKVTNEDTGVEPLIAFVRVVDGDVTDVVYYTVD